jgi:hypothetical protein
MICIIVCSDTINKNFGNESYFIFTYGHFNYRGESPNATPNKDWWRWGRRLPQRHSHHMSQSARLIMICRLGACVRSINREASSTSVVWLTMLAPQLHRMMPLAWIRPNSMSVKPSAFLQTITYPCCKKCDFQNNPRVRKCYAFEPTPTSFMAGTGFRGKWLYIA